MCDINCIKYQNEDSEELFAILIFQLERKKKEKKWCGLWK